MRLAPYFYTWGYGQPAYKVKTLSEAFTKAGLKEVTLAFAIGGSSITDAQIFDLPYSDIKAFQALGGQVTISFGGANGPYLEDFYPDEAKLMSVVDTLLVKSGVRSIDFDIEGAAIAMPVTIGRRNRLIKALKFKYPDLYISITIPSMPTGPDYNGLSLLQALVRDDVPFNLVNLMCMDYQLSNMNGRSHGDCAILASESLFAQLKKLFAGSLTDEKMYSMIGLCPMIGKNDDGTSFTLTDAQTLSTYATSKKLGLLTYWAFQRDQSGTGGLDTHSNVNTSDFQFFQIFKRAQSGVITLPPQPPTNNPPTTTPDPNPSLPPLWVAGSKYKQGDSVSFNGSVYMCLKDHANGNKTPAQAVNLWVLYTALDLWQKGRVYKKGDEVIYLGVKFISAADHIASNPPSMWQIK